MDPPTSTDRLLGGILGTTGFILSPLSWWNDLVVNLPLSYLLASGFEKIFPGYFAAYLISAYWLTNVVGLMLLHKGSKLFVKGKSSGLTTHTVISDLSLALLYSLVIGALAIAGILRPPMQIFR